MQRGEVQQAQWAAGETLLLFWPAWIVFTPNLMNRACLALIVYAGEKHLWVHFKDQDLQYLFYLKECYYLKKVPYYTHIQILIFPLQWSSYARLLSEKTSQISRNNIFNPLLTASVYMFEARDFSCFLYRTFRVLGFLAAAHSILNLNKKTLYTRDRRGNKG